MRPSSHRRTRRAGFTLVEALASIAAASVILSLVGVATHRVMRVSKRATQIQADEATAWRLASALRRDARHAASARVDTEANADILVLSDLMSGEVLYRFGADAVGRETTDAGGTTAREAFFFARPVAWSVRATPTEPTAGRPGRLVVASRTAPDGLVDKATQSGDGAKAAGGRSVDPTLPATRFRVDVAIGYSDVAEAAPAPEPGGQL